MDGHYRTIYRGGSGEITEKKSRFIATIHPVETEEEAVALIGEIKKKYWDASHNCSAYVLGKNQELMRCSDDGEPSQTAGKPMLDLLLKEELHNTCAVVTRYFGGTLLGTGGLVRAYQAALKAGLNSCTMIEKQYGKKYKVVTDYSGLGKLNYIAGQMDLALLDTEYTDVVTITLLLPPEQEKAFSKKLSEATSGQACLTLEQELYYAKLNGETLLFPK